ncbi:ATP-binding protein [Defluviimonas aestuarii]|uniref:sensor histidine kinase n=1 Tax=Albidovulum aestuarii TaxID=1130726 RepID=UPI00249BADF2|nr:ATP-binding protein [Defluviimonas aestuarii]MDI3334926.1 ATP-binding protein [Defluviimonas aestuarii]
MRERISRKWRPPLLLVLGGALAGVLASGLAGLLAMPVLAPILGPRPAALMVFVAVVLVTALLAFLLWRLILRPVTALADRAHRLREGEADAVQPLPHYGTPELRDLGESVLGMASALRNRATTIRSYTDHVTHEFKAPLSAIRGAAELLADADLSAEDRRLVTAITGSAQRMDTLLAALRTVAAAREPAAPGETTLAAILPRLQADHARLSFQTDGNAPSLPLPEPTLSAVLGHLAANAAQHGARTLHLNTTITEGGPILEVGDDGTGIAAGNRARIFEPFFTTRRETDGTGMGLAIAESLLSAHGAGIELTDRQPGAWFRITF